MNVSQEWSQQFDSLSSKLTITADLLGNSYILEPNTDPATSISFTLAKYATNSKLIWQQNIDEAYTIASLAIATNLNQNVYISGIADKQLTLTCLTPSGKQIWQTSEEVASQTAVPKTFLWPQTSGELYMGLYSEPNQIMLQRYTQNGERLESHSWSLGESDELWALTADSTGNLYAAGVITSGKEQNTASLSDTWIAKYTTDGSQLWREYWGASTWDVATCMTCDIQGNIYVAGTTEGQLGEDLARGGADVWLAKYNENGEEQWIEQFGSLATDQLFQIACDYAGNIYLSGQTAGQIAGIPVEEGVGAWIAKYRPHSDLEWIHQWQPNILSVADGLSCDALGSVYWAGRSFFSTEYDQSMGYLKKFRDDPKTMADLRQVMHDQTVGQNP